jgi:uncharacterized membrane protein
MYEDSAATRRLLHVALVLGVGLAASLDEIILHQILQWHHFYHYAPRNWQLISDGLFHIFSAGLLLAGAIWLWRSRGLIQRADGRALTAGLLLGVGGFNLYDGVINHKVLGLHQVREGVDNLWLYDVGFIGLALVVLALGWWRWQAVRASGAGEVRNG